MRRSGGGELIGASRVRAPAGVWLAVSVAARERTSPVRPGPGCPRAHCRRRRLWKLGPTFEQLDDDRSLIRCVDDLDRRLLGARDRQRLAGGAPGRARGGGAGARLRHRHGGGRRARRSGRRPVPRERLATERPCDGIAPRAGAGGDTTIGDGRPRGRWHPTTGRRGSVVAVAARHGGHDDDRSGRSCRRQRRRGDEGDRRERRPRAGARRRRRRRAERERSRRLPVVQCRPGDGIQLRDRVPSRPRTRGCAPGSRSTSRVSADRPATPTTARRRRCRCRRCRVPAWCRSTTRSPTARPR